MKKEYEDKCLQCINLTTWAVKTDECIYPEACNDDMYLGFKQRDCLSCGQNVFIFKSTKPHCYYQLCRDTGNFLEWMPKEVFTSVLKENPDTAPKNHIAESKEQMSLLPLDLLSELLCPAYSEGVQKYERESWRKGFNISVLHDALLRHLKAFIYDKEELDPEALEKFDIKKHHLGAAIFCLISMYDTVKNHKELDDRDMYQSNKKE